MTTIDESFLLMLSKRGGNLLPTQNLSMQYQKTSIPSDIESSTSANPFLPLPCFLKKCCLLLSMSHCNVLKSPSFKSLEADPRPKQSRATVGPFTHEGL